MKFQHRRKEEIVTPKRIFAMVTKVVLCSPGCEHVSSGMVACPLTRGAGWTARWCWSQIREIMWELNFSTQSRILVHIRSATVVMAGKMVINFAGHHHSFNASVLGVVVYCRFVMQVFAFHVYIWQFCVLWCGCWLWCSFGLSTTKYDRNDCSSIKRMEQMRFIHVSFEMHVDSNFWYILEYYTDTE